MTFWVEPMNMICDTNKKKKIFPHKSCVEKDFLSVSESPSSLDRSLHILNSTLLSLAMTHPCACPTAQLETETLVKASTSKHLQHSNSVSSESDDALPMPMPETTTTTHQRQDQPIDATTSSSSNLFLII